MELFCRPLRASLICESMRADTQPGQRFVFARAGAWISTEMAGASQGPIATASSGNPSQLTIMTTMALRQSEGM
jgi:hypothetical protein